MKDNREKYWKSMTESLDEVIQCAWKIATKCSKDNREAFHIFEKALFNVSLDYHRCIFPEKYERS